MNDPENLLPNEHLKNRAIMGRISQVHRGQQYGEAGDTFEVMGSTFEVTDVTERTLGDLELADARQEEETSLEQLLARLRPDYGSEPTDETPVYRHHFERRPSL